MMEDEQEVEHRGSWVPRVEKHMEYKPNGKSLVRGMEVEGGLW